MKLNYSLSLKGNELSQLFEDGTYSSYLFPNYVELGPAIAVKKIAFFFNLQRPFYGYDVLGIEAIRDCISKNQKNGFKNSALVISAPHTHWDTTKPIIHHFDSTRNRYVVGLHNVVLTENYKPVSFVLTERGLIPYEWADSSVQINSKELKTCLSIAHDLQDKFGSKGWPLGISIDFRFKESSLFEDNIGTVEVPTVDIDETKFSSLIKFSDFINQEYQPPIEQVSWLSESDNDLGLSESEIGILKDTRKILKSLKSKQDQTEIIRFLS